MGRNTVGAARLATCLVLGALGIASPARADGGTPRAYDVLVEPGKPGHIVVRSDFWGLFESRDGGQSWRYACNELFGQSSKSGWRGSAALLPGGRVLMAANFAGLVGTDDFCQFGSFGSFDNVSSITLHDQDVYLLSIGRVTDAGASTLRTTVFRSSDHGNTWSPSGKSLPPDYSGASIAVAPSDPKRVYVVGYELGNPAAMIARSSDGGESWALSVVTTPPAGTHVRIQAIHPDRPDVAFVWIDLPAPSQSTPVPDELWGTKDGGATWSRAFTGKNDLAGLAFSPDGTDVLVSGSDAADGIQAALVDDALGAGQAAFHQVFAGKVWGLLQTPDGLYAGNDNFTGRDSQDRPLPAYTLGLSRDDAKTFSSVMNLCQVKLAECGTGSQMEQVCRSAWDEPGRGFEYDFQTSTGRCAPSAPGGDAGSGLHSTTVGSPVSSGCACTMSAGNDRTSGAPGALLAAITVCLGRRWRRRGCTSRRGG